MSANILHALRDENQELEKHIGCMTGIFQLFDRHHLLIGRRIQNPKRLPSAQSRLKNGAEVAGSSSRLVLDEALTKDLIENKGSSVESSGASFSSSSLSSSFSSVECGGKTAQPESPLHRRTTHQDGPLKNCQKLKNHNYADQPDPADAFRSKVRDIPKDSIRKERSEKSSNINQVYSLSHIDSPRPQRPSRTVECNARHDTLTDLTESFRVLAKLKEGPWHTNSARDTLRSPGGKDNLFNSHGPRFSFDGREASRASFDSRETSKSAWRLRELPRLSLDSREISMRNLDFDAKANLMSRHSLSDNERSSGNSGNSSRRTTSVVARLMGLDSMPSMESLNHEIGSIKTRLIEDKEHLVRQKHVGSAASLKMNGEFKQDRGSRSPRSISKEPSSPQVRIQKSVVRPISASRLPIELAPWRQENTSISHKTISRNSNASRYVLIEEKQLDREKGRRFNYLESNHSYNNSRAVKQMLQVMEAKGLLEKKRGKNQIPEALFQRNRSADGCKAKNNSRLSVEQGCTANNHITVPMKGSNFKEFRSPIVIMKPVKLVQESQFSSPSHHVDISSGSYKSHSQLCRELDNRLIPIIDDLRRDKSSKLIPKDMGNLHIVKKSSKTLGDGYTKSDSKSNSSSPRVPLSPREKVSGPRSPRLQRRNIDGEKPRPPLSPDSGKTRKQHTIHTVESGSPGGQNKARIATNGKQSKQVKADVRSGSQITDEVSIRSDGNTSLASEMGIEVTSTDRSAETLSSLISKPCRDDDFVESTIIAPEQPSPISVLDASFDGDDLLPSPVKKVPNPFTVESNEEMDLVINQSPDVLSVSSKILNHERFGDIEKLVQKLKQLSSVSEEGSPDEIAAMPEFTVPDHQYICQILLASGLLLKDLETNPWIQPHPSGKLINPDLFFVLEQTKERWMLKIASNGDVLEHAHLNDKFHRKLIFDTLNEVLAQKLPTQPWVKAHRLRKIPSGKQLLKELCSEIDQLQYNGMHNISDLDDTVDVWKCILEEDVVRGGECWSDFIGDVPAVVLDVERQIFKDLIDEVVTRETLELQNKHSRRRRQLFTKA